MGKTKGVVGIIVAILIGAILVGTLIPVGIGQVNDNDTTSLTQADNTSYEINSRLTTNATNIDVTGDQATIEINTSDETISKTISNQSTETYSFTEGDVNATVDSVNSNSEVVVTYSYPTSFGWSTGSSAIFSLLPLIFVLIPFIAVVAWIFRVL